MLAFVTFGRFMRSPGLRHLCYLHGGFLSANSQISHYARLGQIDAARKVFDKTPHRDVVSWNSIISGYFDNGFPEQACQLFNQMPEKSLASWNGLVSGFVKNGMVDDARRVFDVMPQRNVVSWTAMVRGYVQDGRVDEAERLFWKMPEKNVVSWTVMLGGLIQDRRIDDAQRLFNDMPQKDVVARTNMILGYCREGRVTDARKIFDEMPRRNVITWTTMVSGYASNLMVDIARKLFEVMPGKNEVSWTAMLTGYLQCGRVDDAFELFMTMPQKTLTACNIMVLGLGLNGLAIEARKVFDLMEERDDSSWSAMIKAYERNGLELEAIDLFRSMQKIGVKENHPTFISVLAVCASLAVLNHGREVHAKIVKLDFDSDVFVVSALITLYIKCGNLVRAKCIFDAFRSKDLVMWNSMITGYAQHGLGSEALQIFSEMCSAGMHPDGITFVGVLSACSYSGKVKEGKELFQSMGNNYQVEPKTEHYACMVDLLGRSGHVNEALDLIKGMPMEADAVVWGSLMGACRTYMNLEVAEIAAKKLMILEPWNSGPYVLLSNIYASQGRWKDVQHLRSTMRVKRVNKSPGCSWVEVEQKIHMFTGGTAWTHPEHNQIVELLDKLGGKLKEAGYVPDCTFVLHDIEEEQKVQSLGYHSEKLAVAYGLLKLPKGVPIRVMKNLRVCGDCHMAIKLIAKITNREIILRDATRFHHFANGLCSCNDFW